MINTAAKPPQGPSEETIKKVKTLCVRPASRPCQVLQPHARKRRLRRRAHAQRQESKSEAPGGQEARVVAQGGAPQPRLRLRQAGCCCCRVHRGCRRREDTPDARTPLRRRELLWCSAVIKRQPSRAGRRSAVAWRRAARASTRNRVAIRPGQLLARLHAPAREERGARHGPARGAHGAQLQAAAVAGVVQEAAHVAGARRVEARGPRAVARVLAHEQHVVAARARRILRRQPPPRLLHGQQFACVHMNRPAGSGASATTPQPRSSVRRSSSGTETRCCVTRFAHAAPQPQAGPHSTSGNASTPPPTWAQLQPAGSHTAPTQLQPPPVRSSSASEAAPVHHGVYWNCARSAAASAALGASTTTPSVPQATSHARSCVAASRKPRHTHATTASVRGVARRNTHAHAAASAFCISTACGSTRACLLSCSERAQPREREQNCLQAGVACTRRALPPA